ncbi:MAG: hypothetical protein ACRC2N_09470, partial [Aeromonas sp.]
SVKSKIKRRCTFGNFVDIIEEEARVKHWSMAFPMWYLNKRRVLPLQKSKILVESYWTMDTGSLQLEYEGGLEHGLWLKSIVPRLHQMDVNSEVCT